MFFVAGVNDKHKNLKEVKYSCQCGNDNGIIIIEERVFSLFFLPVFSWNRKYYLECSKCRSIFGIKDEYIKKILKDEIVDRNHLKPLYIREICKICGKEMEKKYDYCPYCGSKNKE